ncbi:unnamed protein product [Cuscuta campestris]|uniref:Uncharacterized protein n=1 Tax=Cuscuta campestris TaxID=132261 RepID=A0A484LPH2_9ASTE|nr:unnamed protein product [Cuscuta campestris]
MEELCMSTTEKGQTSDLCHTVDPEGQIMSPPQRHLKSSKFAVSDFIFGPCFTPKAANFVDYHMHPGMEKLTSHSGKMMSPIEEEENMEEGFMDFTPAVDERHPQTELPPLMCPVNDSDKLPFEQPQSSGSSISPQNSPGESEVKSSSSFPGEKSVEWIVLDSQEENNSCDDDEDNTPAHSSPQRTAKTFVLCNLDEDSTENGSNHIHPSFIQKEAETGIEIIDISSADIESVGFVVEDSEDEEDNIERSKRRQRKTHTMRRLIVDISEDLCI